MLAAQSLMSAAIVALPVLAPKAAPDIGAPVAWVGLFVSLVYGSSMVSGLAAGALVRRWGAVRLCQLCLLAACAGLALIASGSRLGVALGAVLIGAGYGPLNPASSHLLDRFTPAHRRATIFSIKQTGVPLGGVIAGLLVPPLVGLGGGPGALWGLTLLCVLAAASAAPLSAALDGDRDAGSRWPRPAQMLEPVRFVATHAVLRRVALVSFVFSMVQVSLTSYLVTLLTGDLRWTLAAAGAALAMSQVAGVVGRIAWGFIADRGLGARRTLLGLALGMLACTLAMPLLSPASPAWAVTALLAAFGATAVGWNGVYLATVARLVPQPQAGMATAGTLFFTFLGVVIGPSVFGALAGALGGLAQGFALLALPLALGLGVLARSRW